MFASSLRRHYPGQVQRVGDGDGRPLSLASQAPPVPLGYWRIHSTTPVARCQTPGRRCRRFRPAVALLRGPAWPIRGRRRGGGIADTKRPPVWSDWRSWLSSEPRGNRTPNPLIKSQLLCQIELAAHGTISLYLDLRGLSNRGAFRGQATNHEVLMIRHLCRTVL